MVEVLVSAMAVAFALSALEYWTDSPLVNALAGIATASIALALMGVLSPAIVPMSMAAAFLGAVSLSIVRYVELPRRSPRR